MTSVQVQYWNYKENQRHDVETEHETQRHNRVSEQQNQVSLAETIRHDMITEEEIRRHNVEGEKLGFATLSESRRHNVATEHEGQRHNMATEGIQRIQASASMISAKAAAQNAQTAADKAKSEIALNQARTYYQMVSGQSAGLDLNLQNAKQPYKEKLAGVTGVMEALGINDLGKTASSIISGIAKLF